MMAGEWTGDDAAGGSCEPAAKCSRIASAAVISSSKFFHKTGSNTGWLSAGHEEAMDACGVDDGRPVGAGHDE